MESPHHLQTPSAWLTRWVAVLRPRGRALDLACGHGRHARLLASAGHAVVAMDRDEAALAGLAGIAGIETRCADLEAGQWPLGAEQFDAIVVANYLHRPHFPHLIAALRPGGVLIYETFMLGNERFGKPSNPDFLLAPGELLDVARGHLVVLGFEQGRVERPKAAMIQRLCALRGDPGNISLPC